MSSVFGEKVKVSVFGQSHGEAIGCVIDGLPAGFKPDMERLDAFMARRAPGGAFSTKRKEPDKVKFLSGIVDGTLCGAPVAAIIENTNTISKDYSNLYDIPRPGHADYTAEVKYGGFQDVRGGGHFSGRLTAPLCIAGGIMLQMLEERGIEIYARIQSVGGIEDAPAFKYPEKDEMKALDESFPVYSKEQGEKMKAAIEDARMNLDSVGGVVECAVFGLPAGLCGPMAGGAEGIIARNVFGIPAVKAIEFGNGFEASRIKGSENNDPFAFDENGKVITTTNNHGGILGGITSGMPLYFRVGFKPTPSIARKQTSVSLSKKETVDLEIKGRHDPCVVLRAVPVVMSAAAISVMDILEDR